jgi:hypothetical protein
LLAHLVPPAGAVVNRVSLHKLEFDLQFLLALVCKWDSELLGNLNALLHGEGHHAQAVVQLHLALAAELWHLHPAGQHDAVSLGSRRAFSVSEESFHGAVIHVGEVVLEGLLDAEILPLVGEEPHVDDGEHVLGPLGRWALEHDHEVLLALGPQFESYALGEFFRHRVLDVPTLVLHLAVHHPLLPARLHVEGDGVCLLHAWVTTNCFLNIVFIAVGIDGQFDYLVELSEVADHQIRT